MTTHDRMLGRVLKGTGGDQDVVLARVGGGDHRDQVHLAGGDRAGLVEHDGVDLAGGLEDLRPLDEDSELSAAPVKAACAVGPSTKRDLGLLRGVVDRRADPVHPVELPLDAGRARRARHPADRELDGARAGDGAGSEDGVGRGGPGQAWAPCNT